MALAKDTGLRPEDLCEASSPAQALGLGERATFMGTNPKQAPIDHGSHRRVRTCRSCARGGRSIRAALVPAGNLVGWNLSRWEISTSRA